MTTNQSCFPEWGKTLSAIGPLLHPPSGVKCKVFITHAGQQKRTLVDMLRFFFRIRYPDVQLVWVDDFDLQHGGDAFKNMHAALGDAMIVLVVLSDEYITKFWPMEELHLLLKRRRDHPDCEAVLVPIFFGITWDDLWEKVDAFWKVSKEPHFGRPDTCNKLEDLKRLLGITGKDITDRVGLSQQQLGELLGRRLDDLQELLGITGFRPDQADNGRVTDLASMIADFTAKQLDKMGHFQVIKALPNICEPIDRIGRIDGIIAALEAAAAEQKMLLLHGIPGSGLTLASKVVFNELHTRERTMPCHFMRLSGQADIWAQQIAVRQALAIWDGSEELIGDCVNGLRQLHDKMMASKRKVLLVIDCGHDSSSELVNVLPANIMTEVLPAGSMVLVASCTRRPEVLFQDSVKVHQLQALTPGEAWELFCEKVMYMDGLDQEACQLCLQECAGLPKAVVSLASQFGWEPPTCSVEPKEVAKSIHANDVWPAIVQLLEAAPTYDIEAVVTAAFSDIVHFMEGEQWQLVEAFTGYGSLYTLQLKGLVSKLASPRGLLAPPLQRREAAQDVASIDQALRACWQLQDYTSKQPQRPLIEQQIVHFQADSEGKKGLHLRQCAVKVPLDLEHSQAIKLHVLKLENSTLASDTDSLALHLGSLRWLSFEFTTAHGLQSVCLKGNSGTAVLRSLSGVSQVKLLDGGGLKVLCLEDCSELWSLQVEFHSQLELLRLTNCPLLTSISKPDSPAKDHKAMRYWKPQARSSKIASQALVLEATPNVTSLSSVVASLAQVTQLQFIECEQTQLSALQAELTACRQLSSLHLADCRGSASIDLRHLTRLSSLRLARCPNLEVQLPPSIKHLVLWATAPSLNATGAAFPPEPTTSVPINLAGLTSLTHLHMQALNVVQELRLPASLAQLHVSACEELGTIGSLRTQVSLTRLHIADCSVLEKLQLCAALQDLAVQGCPKLAMVEGLDNLPNLTNLHIASCRALQQPAAISLPRSALSVRVEACPAVAVDASQASFLTSLYAARCRGLQEHLPLHLLQLHVVNCPQVQSLTCLTKLTRLTSLSLKELTDLEALGLPPLLKHLALASCPALSALLSLSDMVKLSSLHAPGCGSLRGLQCPSNLRTLHVDLCPATLLDLSALTKLTQLHCHTDQLAGQQLPVSLGTLHLKDTRALPESYLPNLSSAPQLTNLELVQHSRQVHVQPSTTSSQVLSTSERPPIAALQDCTGNLSSVNWAQCSHLKLLVLHGCSLAGCSEPFGALSSLVNMRLIACGGLEHLCVPSCVQQLELQQCSLLASVSALAAEPHLTHLAVNDCSHLERLALPPSLQLLQLTACPSLTAIVTFTLHEATTANQPNTEWLSLPALCELDLHGCPGITSLCLSASCLTSLALHQCNKLRVLRLSGCAATGAGFCVASLAGLTQLHLSSCNRVKELQVPAALQQLFVRECAVLARIPNISGHASLTRLEADSCDHLRHLELPAALQLLHLRRCSNLCGPATSFEQLPATLQELVLKACPAAPPLQLAGLVNLTSLQAAQLPSQQALHPPVNLCQLQLEDCSQLSELVFGQEPVCSLTSLELAQCPCLTTLSPPTSLQHLAVSFCTCLKEIGGLEVVPKFAVVWRKGKGQVLRLERLTQLEVTGCGALTNLKLPSSLRSLRLDNCAGLGEVDISSRMPKQGLLRFTHTDCPKIPQKCTNKLSGYLKQDDTNDQH